MRVAYLTCVFPPYPGGIGVAAAGMAAEMARRGHEVTVVTPSRQWRPWLRYGNAAFLPQLLWRLRRFDIIHVLYPFYGVAELVPILKRATRAKIVVHHLMDAVAPGWLGYFFSWHTKYIAPRIFKAADKVLVLSEDYARNSDVSRLGVPWEVVPNGVDTDLFRPVPQSVISSPDASVGIDSARNLTPTIGQGVRSLGTARDDDRGLPTILFVGGLDRAHYFKGVPVLLKACRILKERVVPYVCKIIGDGDMRIEYERQAKDSPFAKGLSLAEFLGLVPHDQLPPYYQKATVVVVPSTERVECFSLVAAEAQACGVPVIVTDFPGVRVTVEDGVTGYVARPGDPEELANRIQEFIKNPEKSRAMGIAARKRAVELYDWRVIGNKLEKIYKSL